MKNKKTLKIVFFLIAILLISLLSFVGIYQYDKGIMKNVMPEYVLGKELKGSRFITFEVDNSTKTVDVNTDDNSEANTETSEGQDGEAEKQTMQVPVNAPEILTNDNYKLTKEIIEKRLKELKVKEYELRVNEDNGMVTMDLPDETSTDENMQFLYKKGDFSIIDTDTEEILLSKNDIEYAKQVNYTGTKGTAVYLYVKFNKEATQKLEDVTKKYVETTGDDGKTTKQTITIMLDDEKILTTYFGEPISNGEINVPIGDTTSDKDVISAYIRNVEKVAMLLNNQSLPIIYKVSQNEYISPVVTTEVLKIVIIVSIVLATLAVIYMILRYKEKGLYTGISFIGYIAITMMFIRIANVPVAVGSIVAIAIASVIEFIVLLQLLKAKSNKEENDALIRMICMQIPLYVISVVLCFVTLIPMVSFGTALFWGSAISTIYNYIVTKALLKE